MNMDTMLPPDLSLNQMMALSDIEAQAVQQVNQMHKGWHPYTCTCEPCLYSLSEKCLENENLSEMAGGSL